MNKTTIACGLGLIACSLALPVSAEVLSLPSAGSESSVGHTGLPVRGESQTAVLQRHGEPVTRHAPVGGGSPAQPQITRWDYAGFSVIFENAHVVDTVSPDQPAPLFNTDELKATTD